ncbi:MAG: PaaI family thioesterase [Myxococcota bacterium]
MDTLSSEQVETIGSLIVASPYGRLLGLESAGVEVDRVQVRLPFRPEVTTIGEMVHGGAIASLVDTAATAAGWATPKATLGARGTTVGFSLNYLAASLASDLLADARVVKRGGSLTVVEVRVTDAAGQETARALVTYKLSLPKG